MRCSAAASCRTLFEVQRSGDSGSPDAVGSTSPSRSASRVGSFARVLFRPPPGRRTRPGCRAAARPPVPVRPRSIVEYAIPVARATPLMPPRPAARASVAAQIRRARSVKAGARALYFARQSRTSTHPAYRPALIFVQLFSDNALVA